MNERLQRNISGYHGDDHAYAHVSTRTKGEMRGEITRIHLGQLHATRDALPGRHA